MTPQLFTKVLSGYFQPRRCMNRSELSPDRLEAFTRSIEIFQYRVYARAIRRQRADRVGVCGVSGQQRCLTAAAAKIYFLLRATPARLRHPFLPAKPIETFRFAPNPIEGALSNVFKAQIGNCRRSGRAWKHVANRIDGEITLAPTIQTWLWPRLIIIREHIEDVDFAGETRLRGRCDFSCARDLFAGRKQRGTVKKGPAVKLHVGELDPPSAESFGQFNYLR